MQFISKLTSYFVAIGTNTERRTKNIDYGNMAKILYYFIQLIGYIYSQFERKAIQYYENDFLAQVSQQSSIPFMLIIIHYDPLTIFVYFCVFIVMLGTFLIALFQIILKSLPSSSPINRFVKFYFQNFQWFFLTPFNECMIGIITCGKQSYLIQHSEIEPSECLFQISPNYVVISFLGVILVSISGIVSVFYFRNYDFLQAGLLRKFSHINFITIFLHQLLIILSFWKQMYQNEYLIIYSCYFLIMFCLLFDVFTQLPFGFTTETIFYSQILITSIFFGILISYWMFSDSDDGIIFLTSCIMIPLIFTLSQAYFQHQFDEESLRFCSNAGQTMSEFTLEYFVLISHPITMTKQSYFQFIRYLNVHCQTCNDIHCPCKKQLKTFISSNQTLDCEPLYVWVQYQFQKLIAISMNKELPVAIFEQLTIKFVTFLKKYRSNQYLSFKNIQDVVISYKKQQKNSSSSLQFFIHLTRQIQLDSKLDIEQQNRNQHLLSKNEFKSLIDLNLFFFYEIQYMQNIMMALNLQKELWICYINGNIKNYDDFMVQLKKIQFQLSLVQQDINYFISQREDRKYENILIIRLQLLISIVCLDDLNKQLVLAKKLQIMEQKQLAQSSHQFHILNYVSGQAITIQQLVSFEDFDIKNISIKDSYKKFFGYEHPDESPKLNDLIPYNIRSIHKGLIDNFLFLGRSTKMYSSQDTFIVNKNQFIEKVSMSLTVLFPIQGSDYYFYVFAHLLKKSGFQKNSQTMNEEGYMLIDKNFNIFGMSQSIQNKINQLTNSEIKFCQIYDNLSIFHILPELIGKLQEHFTDKQIRNIRLQDEEVIIHKHTMNFILPNQDILMQASNQKVKGAMDFDIKNRHLLNDLIKFEKQFALSQNTSYSFQVELTLISKILYPQINSIQKDFLYFIVDLQFEFDQKPSKCTFQRLPSDSDDNLQKHNSHQKIHNQTQNQSQIAIQSFETENREFLNHKQIRGSSTTSEKRSSNNLNFQITFLRSVMTNSKLPFQMSNLECFFSFQVLLVVGIIIALFMLFERKSSMQSNCIQIITLDLDFLDAYSQIMSGSRHVIYYKDFYSLINDTALSIDDKVLNFSKYNKLYTSWNHLNLGLNRLINIYEHNSKVFQQNSEDSLNIYIINANLQDKIAQSVSELTTYFQIMFQIFYLSQQTQSQNISNYLSDSLDPYQIQISRSLVHYNYFEVVKIFQMKIDDCKSYNDYINQYLDSLSNYLFFGFYIMAILIALSQMIYNHRVNKQIKFNFDIFVKCDSLDGNLFIRKNDQLRHILTRQSFVLSKQSFQKLQEKPFVEYEQIKFSNQNQQQAIVKTFNSQDKHIVIRNHLSKLNQILTLSFICLIGLCYAMGFQIYYNFISQNVHPFNEEAIDSQQLRLISITTINKYDQYLVKTVFESYYNLALNDSSFTITPNQQSDYQILSQLEFNSTLLNQEINQFQHLNFTNFLFNSKTFNAINENEQTEILSHDTCILTGCDMYSELFKQRMFNEVLNPYFYQGIVDLHYILSQIYYEIDISLQYPETNLERFQKIQNFFEEHNYMIYILWGLDAIQYQIAQFCQYFVNVSSDAISNLTLNSQQNIIIIGLLTIFAIIVLQLLFIYYQIQRYHLSKSLLKLIPLEIIFKKNIYKLLVLHEKRSRWDLALQF
ncbi:unnamed protein product (macronuclear) [Paramecium tetraurelia]|uniref:Transmembrane protein n=1 Tax=Paramecium tetraurelia TaxID=5888 RepID=A0D5E9_PARTE|nr:uncharacterized protein GSPATT00013715001 [Paramecium tetraurelia]CAK78266.1 unnamed protein product [Paramecium tetraurelia]|eukprot:XP_001445663.1 hypothetical protein (macronuclear) [Paramecium tetraurelia strain d4-2]